MMAILKMILMFLYLFHSAHSFVHNDVIRSSHSRIPASLSPSNEDVSILLDSKHHSDDWHRYCEDVDKNLEGLVSPSPESFNAIHLAFVRANAAVSLNVEDILALSRYLSKPNYTMELFHDDDIVKWRMIKGRNVEEVIVNSSIAIEVKGRELYQEFSTLQLSQLTLELATNATYHNHEANILSKIHEVAYQAERRISLTLGTDLRGPQSADACFNFALAGVQNSTNSLFRNLISIGIHELKRAGSRSSFPPKNILHIVEKFAASDVRREDAMELYQIAADCLEKKNYNDKLYIESLRTGSFGFHGRPLLWLWRFSSRQKKVEIDYQGKSEWKDDIDWQDAYQDTNKPLVVDIGSGMGTCILGLGSTSSLNVHEKLPIQWSQCNYAGVDLNPALVRFGNGVASRRSSSKKGRVKFFCCPADEFLSKLKSYQGRISLILVNFPSPYRLDSGERGNLQLPSAENFMVTSKLFEQICTLARNNASEAYFMFQTKCEDVAVYLKNECLSNGLSGIIAGDKAVDSIDDIYSRNKSVPKRVKEWLRIEPRAERAEGNLFWSEPILPLDCLPETEVQCLNENKVVHRCLFIYKK